MKQENPKQIVLMQIESITDRDALQEILRAAEGRLRFLERKRVVRIVCQNNEWFAMFGSRAVSLGKRLTPIEAMKQAKIQAPNSMDFILTQPEAEKLRRRDPSLVGWTKNDDGTVMYYFLYPEYDRARKAWYDHHQYASDPLAISHGIGVEGMRILRRLEVEGYQVEISEG